MKGFGRMKGHHHLKLRGGRVTKWRGKAASMAPALAAISLALPFLLPSAPARAACTPDATGLHYTCSGSDTAAQIIGVPNPAPDDASVTMDAGYSLDTTGSGDDGLIITAPDLAGHSLAISDNNNFGATIDADGVGLYALGVGGDVSIDMFGSVSGGTSGILADMAGQGDAAVTVYFGSVSATGDAASDDYAIGVEHSGQGDISISSSATVQFDDNGANDAAIGAMHGGVGDISITVSGDVESDAYGIGVIHYGSGDVDVTVNGLSAVEVNNWHDGVSVDAGDHVADVNVNVRGSITTNNGDGIYVEHDGSALAASTSTITTSNTIVSNGGDGIYLEHSGIGTATITAGGAIEAGDDGVGLVKDNDGNASVTINGAITAGHVGAYIQHSADGDATITANAAITAYGSVANNDVALGVEHAGSGDVWITATAGITSTAHGIGALHIGEGNVSIGAGLIGNIVTIDTTGGNGDGITVDAGDDVADVTVSAHAVINTGNGDGIYVEHDGSSQATSTSTIHAYNDITSAGGDGIYLEHSGTGTSTIIADGAVTALGGDGVGLVKDGDGNAYVTTKGAITAGAIGAYIQHSADGTASITANAAITANGSEANNDVAMGVEHTGDGDVEVTAYANITSTAHGIGVRHTGTADYITITVNNDVTINTTGGDGDGITVDAGDDVADVTVRAHAVINTGNGDGIHVEHDGSSQATSTSTIHAYNDITSGGDYGIFLEHGGAGEASITADAKVDAAHGGIVLSKTGDGKATVTAAAVEADGTAMGQPGIGVKHSANGDIEINANGNVTAKLHGIAALHTGQADEVKVTVNNGVTIDASGGDGHGILVDTTDGGANNMVADVIINANAEIKANTGDAVHVKHDGSGRTASVASVYVHRDISSTSGDGVDLTHNGNGNASITTDGSVNAGNDGLVIAKDGNGDATIMAGGSVTGGRGGIKVDHTGASGDVTIDALAKIDANGGDGVNASVANDGAGDLTVTVNDVEASEDGLDLTNHGSGGVFVTAYGNINGGSPVGDDAIYIETDASAGTAVAGTYAVEVTTAAGKKLEATNDGIDVDHNGAKGVLINSYADIETQNGDGINVYSKGGPVDINSKGKITAGDDGVLAYLAGNGDITIDVDASVDADDDGVYARVGGNGNIDITTTVNAAITTNNDDGVQAIIDNAGDINIETNGSINAGGSGAGVYARNRTGDITIETNGAIDGGSVGIESSVLTNGSISIETNNTVKGNIHGIDVGILGAGTIDVTVNSDVTGGSNGWISTWAIRTETPAGNMTNITINQGTVSAASGQAITNNNGNSNVTIAAAATIEGKIELGGGADNLTINGADVTGVTRFDGGLGHDELTFNGVTLNALNAGTVANWEKLELTGNSNITMNFGTLDVGALAVGAGSVLRAFNSVVVSGNVTNNGTISLHDDATGDILDIGGNLDGDGAYVIDTVLNDGQVDVTDKIVIAGDNNGTITIDVRNAGGTGGDTGTGPTDGIQVVDIQGANNGQLALAGPLVAGGYLYELTQNGYLQSRPIGGGAVAVAPLMMPWSTQGLWQRISNGIASSSARMRDTEVAGFTITPTAAPVELLQGAWVRVRYDYMKADADVITAGAPSDLTARQHRVTAQLGYTHVLSRSAAGQLTGGVFAQYVHTKLSADPNIGQDSASRADAFGGGASLTWLGGNGFYGDLYGEVNRHRMKVRDDSVGDSGKTWATSWNASIEGGYRLPVAPNMNIIPHAQLVMSGSKIEDFSIGTVNYSDMDGSQVVGRLGVSAEVLNMAIGQETELTARFSASVLHAFRRKADMVMSGQTVDTKMARTLMEVSSSLVATTPSQGMSIVLENSFQHSLKGPKQYSFSASLGVKFSF